MKRIILTILLVCAICGTYAQNPAEIEIRKLENAQREAFLKKDTAALYKFFSPAFIVQTPTNKIITLIQLKKLILSGEVNMEAFERVTEKVTLVKNIAIAMGNETLKPSGKMPNAGKTVNRRYTNIWMKNGDSWQLVARQATIISIK